MRVGWGVLGDITCSCAGPSAGGASPGAGPGSSHRPQRGPGRAPQSPAAPGSGSSGTGCRSAPLPGWTGTVGPEQLALVGRIWKMYPTREASRPLPRPGVQEFSLEGLGSTRVRALGGARRPGSAGRVPSGECPRGPSPCSCAPSAASAPTASSSPGPGSQAPPHQQSPGSPLRTHDLRTPTGPEAGQRDWCVIRKSPPCPQAYGTGTQEAGAALPGKGGHNSATCEEAEAIQGNPPDLQPGDRVLARLCLCPPLRPQSSHGTSLGHSFLWQVEKIMPLEEGCVSSA